MNGLRGNPHDTLFCSSGRPWQEIADLTPEDVLIVAPQSNSPGKRDATGAFHPGAAKFCETHDLPLSRIVYFDNKVASRRVRAGSVLTHVEQWHPRVLVAFCHGYTHGVQFGLISSGHPAYSPKDADLFNRFVKALSPTADDPFSAPVVVLYACSTGDDPDDDPDSAPGSGDGSFADCLRDSLCAEWAIHCRVVAHTKAGHSWYSNCLKLFEGDGGNGGGVGADLLAPTPKARARLTEMLKTDWAFRFPFMTIQTIATALAE